MKGADREGLSGIVALFDEMPRSMRLQMGQAIIDSLQHRGELMIADFESDPDMVRTFDVNGACTPPCINGYSVQINVGVIE